MYGTLGTAERVEAYFAAELTAAAWSDPDDGVSGVIGIRTTAELWARSWRKGDFVLRLGVRDPDDFRTPAEADGFATTYTVDIILAAAPPRIRVRNETDIEIAVRTLNDGVDVTIATIGPGMHRDLTQSWFDDCTKHDLIATAYERYVPSNEQVEVARHPPGLCFGDTWTITR
jgi:hypothetical protein